MLAPPLPPPPPPHPTVPLSANNRSEYRLVVAPEDGRGRGAGGMKGIQTPFEGGMDLFGRWRAEMGGGEAG